jgi:hypothetical protein
MVFFSIYLFSYISRHFGNETNTSANVYQLIFLCLYFKLDNFSARSKNLSAVFRNSWRTSIEFRRSGLSSIEVTVHPTQVCSTFGPRKTFSYITISEKYKYTSIHWQYLSSFSFIHSFFCIPSLTRQTDYAYSIVFAKSDCSRWTGEQCDTSSSQSCMHACLDSY